MRYLLAESGVLAAGAAALGVGVAWGGMQLLQTQGATYFPRTQEIRFDARDDLADGSALAMSSALLFGLVPALHATGGAVDEVAAIRADRRPAASASAVCAAASSAAQFAIATPLLIVAALAAREPRSPAAGRPRLRQQHVC